MFLKERLAREGDVLNGVLGAIAAAVAAQAIAAAGADFLVIDREHGPIGRESMQAMIAATAGTACAPLVRVPGIDAAEVKVALDAGAEGIFFPMVRSAGDVEPTIHVAGPLARAGLPAAFASAGFSTSVILNPVQKSL